MASSAVSLLEFQMVAFSLCPHVVFLLHTHPWCLSVYPIYSSYKVTSKIGLDPPILVHLTLIASLKNLSPNIVSHMLMFWGLGLQYMNLGEGTLTIQPVTDTKEISTKLRLHSCLLCQKFSVRNCIVIFFSKYLRN